MVMKHNISGMLVSNSSMWDLTAGVNTASNFALAYAIIVLLFVVSSYFFIRKTSDTGKSFVTGGFLTVVASLLLFYGGKVAGVVFIPDFVMLLMVVLFVFSLSLLYFVRFNRNENR